MTRILTLAALSAVGLASSGCMSAELARVHRDVARDVPTLEGGHALAFGPMTLGLARRIVGSDEDTAELLRHVRGVAVGTYAVGDVTSDLAGARARIAARGWEPVVISRDGGETAFVYARTRGDEIRDLLVVTFDDGQMTLVRVSGHLDAAVRAAMRSGESPIGALRAATGRDATDRPATGA